MAYENLPGIFPTLLDGNLQINAVNANPVVLVIGTAERGPSENLYVVNSVSEATKTFGRSDGTLVRGLYEAVAGGAANLRLCRIGSTAAKLSGVGAGVTITSNQKDADQGTAFSIFWDDSEGRLRVWRVTDDLLVYDNNPAYPSAAIDEQEVSVSGTFTSGTSTDIGTLSVPLTLAAAHGVGGAAYVAGNDGILLSRMELFEKLFSAYKLLENEDIDIVIPMNCFVDDSSVTDMTTTQVVALQVSAPWAASSDYPEPGSSWDVLGKVFAQEYNGEWHFWWDMDRDGIAEVYPSSVGSASASLDAFGATLTAADFHEANFAYLLANFCYEQSENNAEMIGVVGVKPPISWSLKDVSNWIGRSPTLSVDTAGNSVITVNGTGLLSNKWMAGRLGVNGTGLPGHIINDVDGLEGGGFIATDDGWPDGTQQLDDNDHIIDLGKYLSVVISQPVMANPTSPTSYAATGAPIYGGFISSLAANSAPTNKVIPGVRLPFRVAVSKLDDLAGLGYVAFQQKTKGIVVADAPTAARPDCDYRRLSTIRIVKATIDAVRNAGEPFLGEAITGARLAALQTAITQALGKLQKNEYLQRYEMSVTSTPTQQVQGQATVRLLLVPAFELRQIPVVVALAAQ